MESPTERVLIVLEEGRQYVLASLLGLSDAQAAQKPAPDRWSALDCMEHLTVVEDRFLGWIAKGDPHDSPQVDSAKEQRLFGLVTDRSYKAQAPEAVVPVGRFTTCAEAMAAFGLARDRSVQVAKARGAELYAVKVAHPRFGEMNGMELLHLMTGHACRHAAQIRETRESIGA